MEPMEQQTNNDQSPYELTADGKIVLRSVGESRLAAMRDDEIQNLDFENIEVDHLLTLPLAQIERIVKAFPANLVPKMKDSLEAQLGLIQTRIQDKINTNERNIWIGILAANALVMYNEQLEELYHATYRDKSAFMGSLDTVCTHIPVCRDNPNEHLQVIEDDLAERIWEGCNYFILQEEEEIRQKNLADSVNAES